VILSQG